MTAAPVGLTTYPTGTPLVMLAQANIPGLLSTGSVTDKAGPTTCIPRIIAAIRRFRCPSSGSAVLDWSIDGVASGG
jgi:hypothetical protein